MLGWFSALSTAGKIGVVSAASVATVGAVSATNQEVSQPPPCTVKHSTSTTTTLVFFEKKTVDDPSRLKGESVITTAGVNGEKTQIWKDTNYTPEGCNKSTRALESEKITLEPITEITSVGVKVPPPPPAPPPRVESETTNCQGYDPCIPPGPDVDCAGGSGNGPRYTGPVRVTGSDPYDLDRDGDGYGCE